MARKSASQALEMLACSPPSSVWMKRPEGHLDPEDPGEDRLNLTIGALDSRTDENQQWPSRRLAVGDSVTIQIVEAETVDPPSERQIFPEEQRIANVKDNARRFAAELGWTLIEEPSESKG